MNTFEQRFNKKLKEVFFYITYKCNMKCIHCYMGEAKNTNMDVDNFKKLLKKLIDLGMNKATFLGGEPTLHPLLPEIIKITKILGVNYTRLDTNGEFKSDLLKNNDLKLLNDISFSLDGINPQTHGKIRSIKNYYSVINNIEKAISLGYQTRVTMTVNSLNLEQIEKMILKLEKIGVSVLNIHLTSENGRTKNNNWLLVDEKKWIEIYKKIKLKSNNYNIKVKIPRRYIKKNDLDNKITCEAVKCSRLLITPDFKIYSCPLLLDSNRNFAYFQNNNFFYTKDYKNNIFEPSKIEKTFCPLLMKENYRNYKAKKIFPICVSYKQQITSIIANI